MEGALSDKRQSTSVTLSPWTDAFPVKKFGGALVRSAIRARRRRRGSASGAQDASADAPGRSTEPGQPTEPDPSSRPSLVRARRRTLRLVVAVAVAAALVGWLAGSQIRSPADAAREAADIEPSAITAPVERRVLATTIVTRGDGVFAGASDLTVDTGAGADEAGDARPVVTGAVPRVGGELDEGSVALEVSGRPVFVLAGDLPMYRTLGPGMTGRDVRQLEAALARLGHSPGSVDDRFDVRTAAAVEAWYEDAGYEPTGPSAADREELSAADAEVASAGQALDDARAQLDAAVEPPTQAELTAARTEVTTAQAAVDKAVADRTEAVAAAPAAERSRVGREQDLLVTEAQGRLAVAQAALADLQRPPDTTAEQQAVDDAEAVLGSAVSERDQLRGRTGTRVVRGEVVFLPDLPRRVDAVRVRLGDEPSGPALTLSGTEIEVVAEVSAADSRLVEVGDTVELDEDSLGIALTGTVTAIARPGEPSGGGPTGSVDATGGGEAADDPTGASGGDPAGGSGGSAGGSGTTGAGNTDATTSPGGGSSGDAAGAGGTEGAAATDGTGGAGPPGAAGGGTSGLAVHIRPEGRDVARLAGVNVRVTIPVESTGGEVLTVPLAAVTTSADGESRLRVRRTGGGHEDVVVRVGLTAEGFAEVTPVEGRLVAGDEVVLGRR